MFALASGRSEFGGNEKLEPKRASSVRAFSWRPILAHSPLSLDDDDDWNRTRKRPEEEEAKESGAAFVQSSLVVAQLLSRVCHAPANWIKSKKERERERGSGVRESPRAPRVQTAGRLTSGQQPRE